MFLDVEAGDNCPYSLQLVFSALGAPRPVRLVRVYHRDPAGVWCAVTGWDVENRPAGAFAVAVEDSGQAMAYLVYGGSNGVRLGPPGSHWDLAAPDQWGESHLLMADAGDLEWA